MNVICVGVKTGKCEDVNMYKKPPLLEELFAQTLSGENVMYISVIYIYAYIGHIYAHTYIHVLIYLLFFIYIYIFIIIV